MPQVLLGAVALQVLLGSLEAKAPRVLACREPLARLASVGALVPPVRPGPAQRSAALPLYLSGSQQLAPVGTLPVRITSTPHRWP